MNDEKCKDCPSKLKGMADVSKDMEETIIILQQQMSGLVSAYNALAPLIQFMYATGSRTANIHKGQFPLIVLDKIAVHKAIRDLKRVLTAMVDAPEASETRETNCDRDTTLGLLGGNDSCCSPKNPCFFIERREPFCDELLFKLSTCIGIIWYICPESNT